MKRFIDLLGSLVLLFLLAWLFVLIALLFLVTLSFPIFFKQSRIGQHGRSFVLYKFRSLKNTDLPLQQRRFPLGSLLRSTSLDELPQLINVLRGDMSLIGPRPLPMNYLSRFSEEQKLRHQLRPGITGWAQVNGRHGISWQQKFVHDLYYVQNVSFLLDLEILFKTLMLLLSFSRDRSLEEKEFTGNA